MKDQDSAFREVAFLAAARNILPLAEKYMVRIELDKNRHVKVHMRMHFCEH